MTDKLGSGLPAVSRRRALVLGGNALAGIALGRGTALAAENRAASPATATVTSRSGRSYTIVHPKLMHYFGRNSYWYSPRSEHRTYTTKPGEICLDQGWLWSNYPLNRIAAINKIDLGYPERSKSYPNAFGLLFQPSYDVFNLFEVTFTNGTKTIAGIEGTVRGKARVKSLVGNYSARPYDIASITVSDGSIAAIRLTSGAVQEGVSDISSTRDGAFDTLTAHIASQAELVVDCPGREGGVMVTLEPAAFAGRRLALTRVKPLPAIPGYSEGNSSRFSIEGLTPAPVEGEIAWQRRDVESYRCEIDALEGLCTIDGVACRAFLRPKDISAMTLAIENGRTVVEALKLRVGNDVVDAPGLRELTFWYPQWASGFNDSSEEKTFSFRTGEITSDIKLDDLRSLTADASGHAILTTKDGESYDGSIAMDDGKPLGIVGTVENGFGGFPAGACFLLNDIATLGIP